MNGTFLSLSQRDEADGASCSEVASWSKATVSDTWFFGDDHSKALHTGFVPSSYIRTLSGTSSALIAPVTAFGAVADDDFGADAAITATVLLSFSPW